MPGRRACNRPAADSAAVPGPALSLASESLARAAGPVRAASRVARAGTAARRRGRQGGGGIRRGVEAAPGGEVADEVAQGGGGDGLGQEPVHPCPAPADR